ncbi:hypothetical protein P4O66_010062 [Electrophorus voltai]|uniref:Uncharacterized protein n=1 Tax=Electrophorus voltai TaxID=2609070 RepID=A0AAD8Z908_9TELE|nr:hypothetical protein P4O66_010062 [Electrophorus voltai]
MWGNSTLCSIRYSLTGVGSCIELSSGKGQNVNFGTSVVGLSTQHSARLTPSCCFPIFLVLAWVDSIAMTVMSIVLQKDMSLTETLKATGVTSKVLWCAWFSNSALMLNASTILLTAIIMVRGISYGGWRRTNMLTCFANVCSQGCMPLAYPLIYPIGLNLTDPAKPVVEKPKVKRPAFDNPTEEQTKPCEHKDPQEILELQEQLEEHEGNSKNH